jgi:hypothetical protein
MGVYGGKLTDGVGGSFIWLPASNSQYGMSSTEVAIPSGFYP